jgi:hypothetical protein
MAGFEVTLYGRIWVTPEEAEGAVNNASRLIGKTIDTLDGEIGSV